ncbi:hypothetical protein AAFF_G00293220 [Aldrovandia affinis]|uniref:C2H2-type domain-containing protein n=1 Tax=Aldrovandia affinis TaxID=143900 RepID=A0AAD7SSL4_9TELE|nr:hypothetical protein AAFF_G00293220 [Aldrovandia affinis]
MHQFADLMASHAVKDCVQQEALCATREAPGQKAVGLKAQTRHPHSKLPPNYGLQPRPEHREQSREDVRSCSCRQQNQQHARTCPGYPLCPSFPSFLSLKPRETLSSRTKPLKSDRNCLPKDSSAGSVGHDLSLGLGMSLEEPARDPDCPYVPEPGQQLPKQQSQDQADPTQGSPPQAPALPCLCFQTCAQFLCHNQSSLPESALPPAQSPGPFPCFSCHRTFQTCAQLLRHQQSHGQQEGLSQHLCMHCAASFPRPALLLQHQRSQHASKPCGFLCTECGRAFNSHSNLRIHLNVHTGARPYSCADCGKSFSQSGALRVHQRIHTGERPYTCTYCGRGFSNLAGLRAHERTHTGEKPYPCPQCGKCFTQSGALKIHLRIHTGERPFICGHCGKGFSSHSGIRFHHRTVHGAMPKLSITMAAHPGLSPGATTVSSTGPGSNASVGPGTNSNVSSPASIYSNANTCVGPGSNPKADNSPGMDMASSPFPGPVSPPGSSMELRTGSKALPKLSLDPGISGLDLSCGSAVREQRMRPRGGEGCGERARGASSRGMHRALEQREGQTRGEGADKERRERETTGGLAR